MKKLFLASLLLLPAPVFADLGGADITAPGSRTTGNTYDAWCGDEYEDCKVKFEDGKLIVNDGDGIYPSQLTDVLLGHICRRFVFGMPDCMMQSQLNKEWTITYTDSLSRTRTAKITLLHQKTADNFQQDFQIWQNRVMRPVGPSIKID